MNGKERRIPVTVTVMRLLKRRIKKINWPEPNKKLVWALCCVAWNGSFRIHELLSKKREEFDPLVTLLEQDVKLDHTDIQGESVGILKIHLKTQKQNRVGNGVRIEIFGNSSFMCPVKAIETWLQISNLNRRGDLPLFRSENEKCYTGYDFNKDLIELTKGYLNVGKLRSHSFRSGVATEMARLGFTDEEIKRQGKLILIAQFRKNNFIFDRTLEFPSFS